MTKKRLNESEKQYLQSLHLCTNTPTYLEHLPRRRIFNSYLVLYYLESMGINKHIPCAYVVDYTILSTTHDCGTANTAVCTPFRMHMVVIQIRQTDINRASSMVPGKFCKVLRRVTTSRKRKPSIPASYNVEGTRISINSLDKGER